jgi:hypothetical protein
MGLGGDGIIKWRYSGKLVGHYISMGYLLKRNTDSKAFFSIILKILSRSNI